MSKDEYISGAKDFCDYLLKDNQKGLNHENENIQFVATQFGEFIKGAFQVFTDKQD